MQPDELFTLDATVGGTAVATDYEQGWLVDGRAGRPVRGVGGGLSLTITGAAKMCSGVVLAHSNLTVAGTVGGDVSAALTPTTRANGITLNPWDEFTETSVDSLTFVVTGNPVDPVVGELFVGKLRRLARNLHRGQNVWGHQRYAIDPQAEFSSQNPYDRGLEGRRLRGSNLYAPSDFDAIEAMVLSTRDGSRPLVIIPDDDDPTDAWVVKVVGFEWRRVPTSGGDIWYEVVLAFDEVPRHRW